MDTRVAVIGIIVESGESVESLNAILHEYNRLLVGRMGMRRYGAYIINITLLGSESEIRALNHRLTLVPGISVKTTFAKDVFGGKEHETC